MARERLFEPRELRPLGEPLDGEHARAVCVRGEKAARGHRAPVDEDGAHAADLCVARALRAGEAETVAEDVEQQLLGRDLANDGPSVDVELEPHC